MEVEITLPIAVATMTEPATVEREATAEPVPEGRGLPLWAGASFWFRRHHRR